MEQKGYSYSSSCAPLIYGIMFYFYFKARLIPFNEFYSSHVSKIYKIFDEAVNIECDFITNALPVELIGMNSNPASVFVIGTIGEITIQLSLILGNSCEQVVSIFS